MIHRQLIINADDFGLTPGVTEGILHGNNVGCVTSTSVLMNQVMHQRITIPPNPENKLGKGVHLNINTGFPVLPPEDLSTLVQADGSFLSPADLFHNIDQVNLIQVEKEWRAQIIGFLIKFGQPDHLNSHYHVHLHPRLFPVFIQIAGEMRIPIRFPIQMDDLDGFPYDPALNGFGENITPEQVTENIPLLQRSCLRYPDYFCDDFITPNLDQPEVLNRYFHNLPEGITEMMCHPGFLDDMLFQVSREAESRVNALKALTVPQLVGMIENENIELIGFNRV